MEPDVSMTKVTDCAGAGDAGRVGGGQHDQVVALAIDRLREQGGVRRGPGGNADQLVAVGRNRSFGEGGWAMPFSSLVSKG